MGMLALLALAAQGLPAPPATTDPWYVFFDKGTAEMRADQTELLRNVARVGPRACVDLIGHADSDEGSPRTKLALSRRRAAAVKRLLVAQGIRREMIRMEAASDRAPLLRSPDARNCNVAIIFCGP